MHKCAKSGFFSDTKKGMKQKVTEKVEEKTRKDKMAEKRKMRNPDKSIDITENRDWQNRRSGQ
jgi:hypothetical protein